MAEALGVVGSVAAISQLLVYANRLRQVTSTSSSHALLAPEAVQRWINICIMMMNRLDDVCCNNVLDQNTLYEVEQCKIDITRISQQLQPYKGTALESKRMRVKRASFVVRKGQELEVKLAYIQTTLIAIQSYLTLPAKDPSSTQLQLINPAIDQLGDPCSRICDPDNLEAVSEKSDLGKSLLHKGLLNEAESLFSYAYTAHRRILGDAHLKTVQSWANVASVINEMGSHIEAEHIYREVVRGFKQAAGRYHPDTLTAQINLAMSLHDQQKYEQADTNVAPALALLRLRYGTTHKETLWALEFYAVLLHCLARYTSALEVAIEVFRAREACLGRAHCDTQRTLAHVKDLVENCEAEGITDIAPIHYAIQVL